MVEIEIGGIVFSRICETLLHYPRFNMKKIFITLASLGLLMLTSCGAKTTPTTVIPIDNGTPIQNTTNNTYNTNPGTTASPTSTTNTSNTNGATYATQTTTNTGKKVVRRSYTSQRSGVTQTSTYYTYEPYAGYSSDFRGVYPQIIYNNLATGSYGNIPAYNPSGNYRPPVYSPQPYPQSSYPSTSGYSIYDFMGAYNAQH